MSETSISEPNHAGPIKVTISDPATGDVLEERVVANDYVLITVGNRYVKSYQIFGRTHQINIAVKSGAE